VFIYQPGMSANPEKLTAAFFIKNRYKLKKSLLPFSLVVIASSRNMRRNADQFFPFRQSSDLFYLSGIREEKSILIIWRGGNEHDVKEILFIPGYDETRTKWEGPHIDQDSARSISGIQDVRYHSSFVKDMGEFARASNHIFFGTPEHADCQEGVSNEFEIRQLLAREIAHLDQHPIEPLMTRIRMFKEPEELDMMRKAITISRDAFLGSLDLIRPGVAEFRIEAEIALRIRSEGSPGFAFEPIIASGKNALILHYTRNNDVCKEGEMVLMDFGAEWEYYPADISRTVPVSGKFTKRQRALYEACLHVLNQAMKMMTPGKLLQEYHQEVGQLWEEEHIKLGLYSMQDLRDRRDSRPAWQQYYWHGTSHSIGIDVHDPFDRAVKLAPGMVLSCEPGLYIREEEVGIRLENDMLITNDGALNLTADLPIDPNEIEELMHR